MRKLYLIAAMASVGVVFADGVDDGLVREESRKSWHLTIGPVMAPRVRTKVRGPRQMPTRISVPQTDASSGSGTGASVADPSFGYAERQYADGYVKPDEGTSDPDSFVSGLTWNWGANDVGSQYSGGRMEFHTDSTRWSESVESSVRSCGLGSRSDSDRDILLGVEAIGGWTFLDDDTFDASLDGGFRFYGSGDLKSESIYGTSVKTTKTRNEYRFVDSYDASGWTDVPRGSYAGSAGGPGRLIGAMPDRREELSNSADELESYSYFYRSSAKLDYRIWDLRLGPTVGWKVIDRLTIRGGVYGLLGLVDAELKASGVSYGGKKSKCDAVFGIAAGISAQFDITESLFLQGSAEYDWWTDDIDLKAGGANAHIELSDFTVSLALGLEF